MQLISIQPDDVVFAFMGFFLRGKVMLLRSKVNLTISKNDFPARIDVRNLVANYFPCNKEKQNKKEQQKKQRNKMTNIKPRKTNRNTGMELNTLELLMSKENPL